MLSEIDGVQKEYAGLRYLSISDFEVSDFQHERAFNDYRSAARELLHWIQRATRTMQDRALPRNSAELKVGHLMCLKVPLQILFFPATSGRLGPFQS